LFEELDWEINFSIWSKWLILKNGPSNTYLSFDEELAKKYFELREITKTLERPVQDAKFEVVNGKVKEFLGSQAGLSLDWPKIISDAEIILNQKDTENKISLSLISVEPSITNDNVNDLGIVEIIGTGSSDFTGSPKNRVHNIGVGADSVNGSLIAPGAEFSLLAALGEIDGEHGYLQELVIKGNETKPEYGGGLCQIGTTVFRGALSSGLPITARRNHSYRVSYYEPAGTDATIYDPWPDFKFKNDTAKHILIQSRIEGTKVYFDFWGTKDGREIIMTEPEIYNIVSPPEKKIIKTLDLAPGQTKCTERAHNGADAKFDYSVLYPNTTEPVFTTFRSHYVPWQEVCLVGVTQEELDAENASSTPDEIPLDSEQETVAPILTE
jgi:vancomycin resistance protein YoaR